MSNEPTNNVSCEHCGAIGKPAFRRCPLCHAQEVEGHRLEFIAWIHRDGSGVTPMAGKDTSVIERQVYGLQCLSITQGTWIASAFNSYVVRLKDSA
ncbi:MAG: hypothetical protein E6Q97_10950 [Desulfurellales bacterium]|nr:MAG: hypothetical protein E6Q97_10950 [Desulfurellales bacterium]